MSTTLVSRIQSVNPLSINATRNVEQANPAGNSVLQELTQQLSMLLSVLLLITVLDPRKKLKQLLLLSLLKIVSDNTVQIKLKLVLKIQDASELFKTVNMSAMITKLAGPTVLLRKEIPQQVLSGSVSLIMTASIKSQLLLQSKTLRVASRRTVPLNGLLVRKILNASQLSMTA